MFFMMVCGLSFKETVAQSNGLTNQVGEATNQVEVLLCPEGTVIEYARVLNEAKVISNPWVFLIKACFAGRIQPGIYKLSKHQHVDSLLEQITKKQIYRVTLTEGMTVQEIIQKLYDIPFLEGGIFEIPYEGSLLPATYHVSFEQTRSHLMKRMQRTMHETLNHLWNQGGSAKHKFKTQNEWVTLASIVEKETRLATERARVAAVFLNRLAIHMPLQADPTVVYAITQGAGTSALGRSLTKADLKTNSPFNSYTNRGLPPTPIACPGKASLEAALNPAQTEEYYFVADGNGGHRFAKTLTQHNGNVRLWKQRLQNGP